MITASTLMLGGYSKDGTPFIKVSIGDAKPNTLKFSRNGLPWWGVGGGSTETIITGNVKRILKVDWAYVKTVINVDG